MKERKHKNEEKTFHILGGKRFIHVVKPYIQEYVVSKKRELRDCGKGFHDVPLFRWVKRCL